MPAWDSGLKGIDRSGNRILWVVDKHPYKLYFQLNEIEHTKAKAKSPQTNGICERASSDLPEKGLFGL